MIGTAGRSLNVFYNERKTNDWLLPLWPNHFDHRELKMVIGTSAAIFVLNAILAVSLLITAVRLRNTYCSDPMADGSFLAPCQYSCSRVRPS